MKKSISSVDNQKLIIGVDEVGRGPLAGPITLVGFLAPENLRTRLVQILGGKIKDSKQFSHQKRKGIYKQFLRLKKEEKVFFAVSHISNKVIDKFGISRATKLGVNRSLRNCREDAHLGKRWASSRQIEIRLDGLLKAPKEYKNQKTIIGGDRKNVFIACASIVAKARRDHLMCRLAKKFPQYSFEIHKGYGTANHLKLIKKLGLSTLHRLSFCSRIQQW